MKKADIYKKYSEKGVSIKNIDLILEKITGLSSSQLFLSNDIENKYNKILEEKMDLLEKGMPLEYVLEHANFYGLDFFVDSRVLIPRNDTEVMVDEALNQISNQLNIHNKDIHFSLIDVGTGSGNIPIAIMKNSQHIQNCYLIDSEKDALSVAQKNINKHGLHNKSTLFHGHLLDDFLVNNQDLNLSPFLVITANLPYIKNGDYQSMDPEVVYYEPDSALYGGEKTGFELYEKLINQILQLQHIHHFKNLVLFIEIGFDQYEYSKNFLENKKLNFTYYKDKGAVNRCIRIEF